MSFSRFSRRDLVLVFRLRMNRDYIHLDESSLILIGKWNVNTVIQHDINLLFFKLGFKNLKIF